MLDNANAASEQLRVAVGGNAGVLQIEEPMTTYPSGSRVQSNTEDADVEPELPTI